MTGRGRRSTRRARRCSAWRSYAPRSPGASGTADIGALRAALAAVCAEVRLGGTVADGMVALDYIPRVDEWQRVGIGFEVAANNMSGSGVPL